MAFYQILYWQDIPSQIKVWDDFDEVGIELASSMEQIDRVAQAQGLINSDDYLNQWSWSEEQERPGSARELAEALQKELEADFDIS